MVAILGLGAAVVLVLKGTQSSPVAATFPSTTARIDGISCDNSNPIYHEHAHLTILDAGHPVEVPANIGIRGNTCLYWMHTHDNSGEIHLETPGPTNFTLGEFFDIWHQPLSRTQAASATLQPGKTMRIYVNLKLYRGDPRAITLHRHTLVTIEIGPPYRPADLFDWQGD